MTGCSSPRLSGKTPAEILYKEALELNEDGHYLMAMEKLNLLRSKYPYSYYATHAELLNADILFNQESYQEAASAYIVFRDFHPQHKKSSHVLWRIAESFYRQLPPSFDRDLALGEESIRYYKELLNKYPNSQYTLKAREKIRNCEMMLEKKDRYIADFYFKTEVFDAARYCYLDILKKFSTPHSKTLRGHAMLRVMESSLRLKKPTECRRYFNRFRSLASPPLLGKIKEVHEECTSNKETP